jgi:tetratricopeptide (TPR) repeat protein
MSNETIAELRQTAEADPDNAASQAALGTALLGAGQFAEAAESFQKAATVQPDNAVYQEALARALLGQGRPGSAADAFRKAIQLDQDSAAYHAGLSQALAAQHDRDGARDELREALSLDPANAGYAAELGEITRRYRRWAFMRAAWAFVRAAWAFARAAWASMRRLAKLAAWIIIPLLIIGVFAWLSAPDLESQLVNPPQSSAKCSTPKAGGNAAGATTVTAKLLGGQRGEADFGHSLTARTLTIDLSLSAVPEGSTVFSVRPNPFLRADDASLNPSDILAAAHTDGNVLILTVCFARNTPGSSLGDPGFYAGSVTLDDARLSAPVTIPLNVTMQYQNGVFLLWLYFAAAIPGAWCVWVLKRPRDGTASALSRDFFQWAGTVNGLVALVSGGIAAFAVYTAVYLRDPTWGSSALQPLTLFGGMFSAFVTTSGLASLASQKTQGQPPVELS